MSMATYHSPFSSRMGTKGCLSCRGKAKQAKEENEDKFHVLKFYILFLKSWTGFVKTRKDSGAV